MPTRECTGRRPRGVPCSIRARTRRGVLPEPVHPPKELPEDAAATDEAERDADLLGRDLEGEPIRVSFNELPLAVFIHQVFGEELGLSHVIAPGPTRA